jgi:hypothetical protein
MSLKKKVGRERMEVVTALSPLYCPAVISLFADHLRSAVGETDCSHNRDFVHSVFLEWNNPVKCWLATKRSILARNGQTKTSERREDMEGGAHSQIGSAEEAAAG